MSFQDVQEGRALRGRQGEQGGQAVAGGIFKINTAVSSFKRLVNDLGTSKDTPQLRERLHKTRQDIGQLVKETSAKLKAASETDQHQEVPATKKIADAKLARDFQAVLKEFQKAQQLAAERETAYTPFVAQPAESSYTLSEVQLGAEGNEEQQALLQEQKRQEFFRLDSEVVFNEAIIEEREQGIKEIQEQIYEVNEIFRDLAVLVNEQGVVIDDIGSNIESSHSATVQAKSSLAQASKSQKSRKCMSCWLPLVILGVVVLVVILVLVL
uniref:t-SNARE coiled-coil homology domain-containing protein n=1 Tax=Araucaria cunninghamii TaxID=56994 RepID=A0A0D6R814_ARACU